MRPRSLFALAALVAATTTAALSNTPAPNTSADNPPSASAVVDSAFAAMASASTRSVPASGTLPGMPADAYALALAPAPGHAPVSAPANAPADGAATLPPPPPPPSIVITVDKATQRMNVRVNGEHRWNWPVSTGQRGYATPRGTFKPMYMSRHHKSREWNNAPMPYAIFFTSRGHAIHASDAVWRLGSPASHGCVRLSLSNARQLFALVQQHGVANTVVTITGSEQAPAVARRTNPASKAQSNGRAQTSKAPQPSMKRHAPPAPRQRVAMPQTPVRPVNITP